MKILWISPRGDGAEIAGRILRRGHQLVLYGEGAGMPLVRQADLWAFARVTDLAVVDSSFEVVRNKRSWVPHRDALFFEELRRKHHFVALGPTPTVDLLVGDRRYLRKWCRTLGIPYVPETPDGTEPWSSGAWFRKNDVIPPGPYLQEWVPLFKSIGFRGWFALHGYIGEDAPVVTACSSSWPPESIPEGREAEFLLEMVT